MSTEIQSVDKYQLTKEQIQTLEQAQIIPSGTPGAIIKVFALNCSAHKLDPFKKEIFLLSYNSKKIVNGKETWEKKYATIVGRDGLRIKAQRTGQLAGVDNPKYDLKSDGSYKLPSDYNSGELPSTCTITVYRLIGGQRCPFTSTVLFSEFKGTQKWLSMPFHMIAKVAEAHALRMGFGEETQGLYVEEEMSAFDEVKENSVKEIEDSGLLEIKEGLNLCNDIEEVKKYYVQLEKSGLMNEEVKKLFTSRKIKLQ